MVQMTHDSETARLVDEIRFETNQAPRWYDRLVGFDTDLVNPPGGIGVMSHLYHDSETARLVDEIRFETNQAPRWYECLDANILAVMVHACNFPLAASQVLKRISSTR